jgi:hypothetical protein
MTSSSDTEFSKRRIYVDGLPHKCTNAEVRSIFAPYGPVAFVHLNRNGYGFVTFEEEEVAATALSAHGTFFKQCRLTVQTEAEAALPFPVVAAKREVHFPKPFGGRSGGPFPCKASSNHHRNANNAAQAQMPGTGSSRQQRTGARGQRLERRSSHPNIVKIIQSPSEAAAKNEAQPDCHFPQGFPERYQILFSFNNFPHVAQKIFKYLDSVTLLRCRLVCKEWSHNIDHHVITSPIYGPILQDNWRNGPNCSIYPLTPEGNDLMMLHSPESRYRNILSFKADENEIMLAVDNGNVEIYDRSSRRLTCLLAGQYSASPVRLDFNSNLIFVNYTCAFAATRRRHVPSSWWNIFCRITKRLLRSIDRDNAGTSIDLRLNFDNMLFLTNSHAIYSIDVIGSSRPQMNKIVSLYSEDRIEAVDFESGKIVAIVHRNHKLVLHVWKQPNPIIKVATTTAAATATDDLDVMTNCETIFDLLPFTTEPFVEGFHEDKCQCMSVQVRYPLCMSVLSNNQGSYEYLGGKPYVLIVFTNLITEECVRMLKFDPIWMHRMSDILVPYDSESCVLAANFSANHLVVGFGSFSDKKDGALAIWSMNEILDEVIHEEELTVWTVPAPTYHWGSWDGHTGGVNCIHIDSLGLIASNACRHQVTTRCIERGDESKKDNVIIYDFWNPGKDTRREQRVNVPFISHPLL